MAWASRLKCRGGALPCPICCCTPPVPVPPPPEGLVADAAEKGAWPGRAKSKPDMPAPTLPFPPLPPAPAAAPAPPPAAPAAEEEEVAVVEREMSTSTSLEGVARPVMKLPKTRTWAPMPGSASKTSLDTSHTARSSCMRRKCACAEHHACSFTSSACSWYSSQGGAPVPGSGTHRSSTVTRRPGCPLSMSRRMLGMGRTVGTGEGRGGRRGRLTPSPEPPAAAAIVARATA